MKTKRYASLDSLQTFLDNAKNTFSSVSHQHNLSEIIDSTGLTHSCNDDCSEATFGVGAGVQISSSWDKGNIQIGGVDGQSPINIGNESIAGVRYEDIVTKNNVNEFCKVYAHTITFRNTEGDNRFDFYCTLYRTSAEQITSFANILSEVLGGFTLLQLITKSNSRVPIGYFKESETVIQVKYIDAIDANTGEVTFASAFFDISNATISEYVVNEI